MTTVPPVIGMATGCFDLLHPGHVYFLTLCRMQCDKLVVGVDADLMVAASKGATRPVMPMSDRVAMVRALKCVDHVFISCKLSDHERAAERFKISKLFKSDKFRDYREYVYGLLPGAELVIIPDQPGLPSTSEIIRRIQHRG